MARIQKQLSKRLNQKISIYQKIKKFFKSKNKVKPMKKSEKIKNLDTSTKNIEAILKSQLYGKSLEIFPSSHRLRLSLEKFFKSQYHYYGMILLNIASSVIIAFEHPLKGPDANS